MILGSLFSKPASITSQAEDKEAKKDKKDAGQKDKLERSVLRFPPEIAPVKCALLSLDMRVARDVRYEELCRSLTGQLGARGISSRRDDSGALPSGLGVGGGGGKGSLQVTGSHPHCLPFFPHSLPGVVR